ncbi:MAG: hypothetical protein ACK5DV_16910, partial [Planctomycetota bacterium]
MANAFGKARSGGRRNTQAGELDITSYAYYDANYARVQPGMREKSGAAQAAICTNMPDAETWRVAPYSAVRGSSVPLGDKHVHLFLYLCACVDGWGCYRHKSFGPWPAHFY